MQIGKLRKIFDTATDLKTEVNRAYVIRKLGTSSTTVQNLYIDGKFVGNAKGGISPLKALHTNLWGPIALGENFLVIPPLYVFAAEGTSGEKMVFDGEVCVLEAGEALPTELMDRFEEQSRKYLRLDTRKHDHGAGKTWNKDQELSVGKFKPAGNERLTFNSIIGVHIDNVTYSDGDIGIVLKLDGVPLDQLAKGGGKLGIDALAIPKPPEYNSQHEPITLARNPAVVEPNHELEVTAINTSDGNFTVGTDVHIKIHLAIAYQKERVR